MITIGSLNIPNTKQDTRNGIKIKQIQYNYSSCKLMTINTVNRSQNNSWGTLLLIPNKYCPKYGDMTKFFSSLFNTNPKE